MLASSELRIKSRFFISRIFITCLILLPIIAVGCDMGTYNQRLNSSAPTEVDEADTQGSDTNSAPSDTNSVP